MSQPPCPGGPETWTLHVLVAPARLTGARLEPSVRHFFTHEEALAAQAVWKERQAGNPDAISSVAPWQPGKEAKKALGRKGRR